MTELPPTALTATECWALLRSDTLGRVALAAGGEIDIFPVNYVVDADETIVFRTAPGTKLAELTIRPTVAFEIDGAVRADLFSVIVKGEARRIEDPAEIAAAAELPLTPWIPTVKEHFIRIVPSWVTGRRFTPGPEPEIDPAGTAA
ncbi:MAG: pyridoxamine 5'-phosphate oxidase family protein [Microbacteriaceae bacterium]|nr:pyridoxamine 5'-phosphate oxidase family protein [Microbacteriaceae bacterium]